MKLKRRAADYYYIEQDPKWVLTRASWRDDYYVWLWEYRGPLRNVWEAYPTSPMQVLVEYYDTKAEAVEAMRSEWPKWLKAMQGIEDDAVSD